MGLRKVLLAFAMLLTFVTPAEAFAPCRLWERQVYGITTEGGLVEHGFCLDADRAPGVTRWSRERVVATSGWGNVSTVFWSGHKNPSGERVDSVYYRVVGSGLFWSADLNTWQQIGRGTDWSRFNSLISQSPDDPLVEPEPGVIYGTEPSGLVRRWEHLGWRDGTDTWAAESVVAALSGGSRLLGRVREGFHGVDSSGHSDIVNVWPRDFIKNSVRMKVPPGVDRDRLAPFDLSGRYTNSAFGLTAAGKLVLLLPVSCAGVNRTWIADDDTGGAYRHIFVGGYLWTGGTGPVEWQCDGGTEGWLD